MTLAMLEAWHDAWDRTVAERGMDAADFAQMVADEAALRCPGAVYDIDNGPGQVLRYSPPSMWDWGKY